MEQRPNSKVPYVRSLSQQNQPVTQEVHALVFPTMIRDLLRTLTSPKPRDKPRLSRQTQTRFSREIISDPEAPLQNCTEQVRLSVISF